VYAALEVDYGPFTSELVRMDAGRVALSWVNLRAATEALDAARLLTRGHGRRPSPKHIERLARRQGLADMSYAAALDKFRALVGANGKPLDLARAIQQQQHGNGTP
jgi:hypothetical protein